MKKLNEKAIVRDFFFYKFLFKKKYIEILFNVIL